MKPEVKKLILSNLPYLIFVYLFGKLGQAYRLAAGVDLSEKLLHFMDGCSAAFANAAPSIHPFDLLIGVAGAAALRLMVYFKGKNAKKYRKGAEYGSARWGTAKDIAPYIDPNFDNNILLTQTERLTMNNRPKDPKTARNKNVLVIGGSGSGRGSVPEGLHSGMEDTAVPSGAGADVWEYQRGRKRKGFSHPNPSGSAGIIPGPHATHRA